ncbi:MAG: DUF4190 domain-containing protein [Xanthomonadales bacterium]|nr:DUF4190 domain-containing protein [Xanthomonadales bacterium]
MNEIRTIPAQTSGSAVASLIFGILAWVFLPLIGALVAVILGHIARGEIRRAPRGAIEGDGLAIAGLVLGYVQIAFCVLVLIAIVLALAIGVGLLSAS